MLVFDIADNKHDAVLWNITYVACISTSAPPGMGEEAIEMFFKMVKYNQKIFLMYIW